MCVSTSKTPDLRVRPTGSANGGARVPRYGQLAGPRSRSVFNTPLFFTIFFRHLCLRTCHLEVSLSPCLSTLLAAENAHVWPLPPPAARPSRRAGRPKPRHAKVGAAMPAELGQSTRSWGVLKETKKGTSISPGTQGSVSASSSGPGYGQWPGIRRPGTV